MHAPQRMHLSDGQKSAMPRRRIALARSGARSWSVATCKASCQASTARAVSPQAATAELAVPGPRKSALSPALVARSGMTPPRD